MALRARKVSGAFKKRDPGYGRVEYTGCAPFSYSASISQSPRYNLYRIQKECNLPEASWARYREYCKVLNFPWVRETASFGCPMFDLSVVIVIETHSKS